MTLAKAMTGGRSALIGYTGFVGANLDAQATFTDRFRSLDIDCMRGAWYDVIVCAGAPGVKWKANQDPATDQHAIQRLTDVLATVRARRLILISTVDVYPDPRNVDERSDFDPGAASPYGRHRYLLEEFVRARFDAIVLRLPGLFGPGLRKNLIFDLLNGRDVSGFNGLSRFQFYDLRRLWSDIDVATQAGLPLVNFATEPVAVAEVASMAFGASFTNVGAPPVVCYDMRTTYAPAWGRNGPYLIGADEVMRDIAAFATAEGWAG